MTEAATGGDEARDGRKLRNEFRRFVDWVFGPEGIASLQIIIFGDFAYGGRVNLTRDNLVYRRCIEGGNNHRLVSEYGAEWVEVRDAYRNAVEACPVSPLLG